MKLLSDQIDERELTIIRRELGKVLTQNIPGDVVEFGCYVGTASVPLALDLKATNRTLHLYDSFEGLPPKTPEDESPTGDAFRPGELHASKKQLIRNLKQAGVPMPRIKKAWFSDLDTDDVPHQIAFTFLDGDYYASIRDPLHLITPYLSPGAIIVVDDYQNEALPGAARAVDEWVKRYGYAVRREHSLGIIVVT